MMSKAVMIAKQTFLQELASARVIMGYLLGLAFLATGLEDFWHFVTYTGEPVNVFETFIVAESQTRAGFLWALGYMLIISDAPFVNKGLYLVLYRCKRYAWNMGMALYIAFQAFVYTLLFAAVSALAGIRSGYIGMIWSSPVYTLMKDTSGVFLKKFGMSFPYETVMRKMTVVSAFGSAFLNMLCYLLLIGMILYVCNLTLGGMWGMAAVVLLHLTKGAAWCKISIDGSPDTLYIKITLIAVMTIVSFIAVRKGVDYG